MPSMKTSGWLFLAGGALAAIGLFAFWPALLAVPFISYGAWKQRAVEQRAHRALVARMRATGRN